jgi:hypothetical protein
VDGELNDLQVTVLLCDAAESVGGKLYILGGGWSQVQVPNTPINMALAVKLSIPWSQANRPIPIKAALYDEDRHNIIGLGEEQVPIELEGNIEAGRPPGLRPGTSLDAPFVLNFPGVALPPGGYEWVLEVDGTVRASTPFRVVEPR